MPTLRSSCLIASRNPADTEIGPVRTETLVLSDGNGTFGISKDGTVTVLTGYPGAIGNKFAKGSSNYDQVIKNLAVVSNNEDRLAAFLGTAAVVSALSSPAVVSADTGTPAATVELVTIPFYKKPWFVPVAIVTGVVGGGAAWLLLTSVAGGGTVWMLSKNARKNAKKRR